MPEHEHYPFVVSDASKLFSTGRSASICICSWGPTCVLTPELGTTTERAEALAAAMALENALELLEDPDCPPVTVHTDQNWLALNHEVGPVRWARATERALVIEEYLAAMLDEARPAIAAGRLTISWLKSHQRASSPAERLMRHADALAFLVASGAIDAQGQLPRTPQEVYQERMVAGRNDPVINDSVRKVLVSANSKLRQARKAVAAPARSLETLTKSGTIRTLTVKRSSMIDEILGEVILLDMRQAPFTLSDTLRRRSIMTMDARPEKVLALALIEAFGIRERSGPNRLPPCVCVLGPIPSLKKAIGSDVRLRELIEESETSGLAPIGLASLSRKTAMAQPVLSELLHFAHRRRPKNRANP